MKDDEDSHSARSVISDKEGVSTKHKARQEPKKAYPEKYQLVPYKTVSSTEHRAMMEIEKIKQRKLNKIHQKELANDAKAQREIKAKRILKGQLERRKIELGVGSRVIYIYIYIYIEPNKYGGEITV